jgi:hypothetical protein
VRLLFNPPELSDLGAVRFGNITELLHCTSPCNHLEKERDACSVPTQPLAVTMPVETDNVVAAAIFFWFCAARSRAPRVYFQRKDHKPHFLRPFPSLLTSMGSMCFRRSERQQKCPSAPSNATVGADGDVAIVSFFLSVFSQAYLCPRRSANQDGAEEERSCPCPRGGHDERKFAAEGSGTGGLIIPLFVEEEEATCVEESTCLLSFFEFPFVACCLFLLFSRFVSTTAAIAFFFYFLASRSRALAYIFEKGSSLALSVAFYIAADDKGERSVNRTLNRTLKPKRKP